MSSGARLTGTFRLRSFRSFLEPNADFQQKLPIINDRPMDTAIQNMVLKMPKILRLWYVATIDGRLSVLSVVSSGWMTSLKWIPHLLMESEIERAVSPTRSRPKRDRWLDVDLPSPVSAVFGVHPCELEPGDTNNGF